MSVSIIGRLCRPVTVSAPVSEIQGFCCRYRSAAEQVNQGVSPIVDPDISNFLRDKDLDLTATLDFDAAVSTSDFKM